MFPCSRDGMALRRHILSRRRRDAFRKSSPAGAIQFYSRKCEVVICAVGFVSRLLHTSKIDATNLFGHALKFISMRIEGFPLKNLVIKHFRTQSGVGQEFSGR